MRVAAQREKQRHKKRGQYHIVANTTSLPWHSHSAPHFCTTTRTTATKPAPPTFNEASALASLTSPSPSPAAQGDPIALECWLTMEGHRSSVTAVAALGDTIFSGSKDGDLRVSDISHALLLWVTAVSHS